MTRVHLTLKSKNVKVGPIPVSTTEEASCPNTCPFVGKGCYAKSGPLALHWKKVSDGSRGLSWDAFVAAIASLPHGQEWRHNQAGDLPHVNGEIDGRAMRELVEANKGKRGFTYTHHDVTNWRNAATVRTCNDEGFTVNLSGNNPAHADELLALDCGPVVTVLSGDVEGKQDLFTPNGTRIVVCPATYRDDTTCQSCMLCQKADRNVVVGFPAHGSQHAAVTAVATA